MENSRNLQKYNLLCKIKHTPLIATKIFEYTLSRPFILHQTIKESKIIKKKLEKFQISKINGLSKETNTIYSLFFNTLNFNKEFQ